MVRRKDEHMGLTIGFERDELDSLEEIEKKQSQEIPKKNYWLTFFSMMFSVVCYGYILNFTIATGFVFLLLVHEMGHVFAAWWRGIQASAPVFIPFLGAFINVREEDIETSQDDAWIGIGGPLLGGIGVVVFLLLSRVYFPDSLDLKTVVLFGSFVNLMNLMPVHPLDGGRIAQIVGKWTRVLGVVCLVCYTWWASNPFLIVIWLFVLQDLRTRKPYRAPVFLWERIVWAGGYISLAIGLFILLAYTARIMPS